MERLQSKLNDRYNHCDWFFSLKDQYVLFELTDYCNLNCIMCSHEYRPGPHKTLKGFMEPSLFENILFNIPPKQVPWTIKLFWLGEPLLHPQFPEFLSIVDRYISKIDPKAVADIHTNGVYLFRYLKELIKMDTRLPFLTVSLDAFNNDTYRKIRKGSVDLRKIYNDVITFLKYRESCLQSAPNLILQFIFMEENSEEVFDYIRYWTKILEENGNHGDCVYIKRKDLHFEDRQAEYDRIYNKFLNTLPNEVETESAFLKVDGFYSKDIISDVIEITPCSAPWKTPVINHNGDMTICCFDSFFDFKIGSLKKSSFKDLWFSKKMSSIRRMIYLHEYDRIISKNGKKRCVGCIHVPWPKWDDGELEMIKRGLNV
ncbi:SPASM domain-containing protein [bacterium]|nr:SPASM domain-containing protein [bacterium]